MKKISFIFMLFAFVICGFMSEAHAKDMNQKLAKTLLEKQYGQNAGIQILGIYEETDTKVYVFAYIGKENNQHDYICLKLSDGRWVLAPKGGFMGGKEVADNLKKGLFVK